MKTRLLALPAVLALTSAAQTFRVSGTVVDSENGAPLQRTRVVLTGGPAREQSVITSGNGQFSFDVPEGRYHLLAAHRDWEDSYGQLVPSSRSDTAIVMGPDQDTSQIVLRWHAPGAICGRVVDESGEPVYAANIELFSESVVGGRKRLISLGRAESNELGNYYWSSISAGTYYLVATGEPWYFTDRFARRQLTETNSPPLAFAPRYFPDAADARAATPLVLRPGAELRANFTLRPAVGANLRFACPNSPCVGSAALYAAGIRGVETFVRMTYDVESDVISGILPGRYIIRYTGVEESMRKVIDIAGDVTVEITPKPAPTLAGKVTFENPAHQPHHSVYVKLVDDDTGQSLAVLLGREGGFAWPAVAASRLRLLLAGDEGFFISRMSVNGASVKNGVIEVEDGAAIEVNLVASGESGRLKGFVRNGGQPVPAALVVLVGSADPYGIQTGSDGSFDYTSIPAGDYVLFAVDNLELEYANAEVVRPYLARGKAVRIEPRGVQTETIGLSVSAGPTLPSPPRP